MQKQQGFTLVELVIVIVILGILAVTAAPKFLNLAGDAKAGTLEAVKASLQSANSVIYSKAILQNKQKDPTATVTETTATGGTIAVAYGYIAADDDAVRAVLDLEAGDFTVAQGDGTATAATNVMIYTGTTAPTATAACMLVYTAAADANSKPTYSIVPTGC